MTESVGHCICHRFYGFYGSKCEELSVSSHLFFCGSCIVFMIAFMVGWYNLILVRQMYRSGKLKLLNNTTLAIGANSLVSVAVMFMTVLFAATIYSVDRQMYMDQHFRTNIALTIISLQYLSAIALGVRVYWIDFSGIGLETSSPDKLTHKLLIGVGGVFFIMLSVLLFLHLKVASFAGLLSPMIVGWTYYFGGKQVVNRLLREHSAIENKNKRQNAFSVDAAKAVHRSSRNVYRYALLDCLFVTGVIFTIPMSRPWYSSQNDLPRFCQGQLFSLSVREVPTRKNTHRHTNSVDRWRDTFFPSITKRSF
jgi:hypothetical protein